MDKLSKPDVYVVVRILERLSLRGPDHPRTKLQFAVRLNTKVFTRYMAWLCAKDYVTTHVGGDKETFSITRKGIAVLQSLTTWIQATMGLEQR